MNEPVNNFSLNEYLRQNKSDNACGHTTLNISASDFEKVGDLYDKRLVHLSYASLAPEKQDEIPISCYPYQDCEVWKCKTCGQVVFYYMNHGWIAPRPEYIVADGKKNYATEPCVARISESISIFEELKKQIPSLGQPPRKTELHHPLTHKKTDPLTVYNFGEHTGNMYCEIAGPYAEILLVKETLRKIKGE